ncbi:restriction endonuclease subunit S [Schaedlerella arabinosiphila]|uniref:Restriction endonuclease subunit S n=2 Tax=cellular organisms TaxID=131567 RepID=A0A9X5CED9_9FIRM|nr:restriction endonuclease subunit S [Schaedlerella arabinosiphila]NDO71397.1 restriction endonuclease subunit S [Schaedlerella arabinosiphila]
MENVSSSNGLEKRPKLRFPGFDEPWKENELSHYLVENTERNRGLAFGKEDVLSVSGEYGVINQIAFQGRSFAGESVADYHVVETDDIVYTKSPLKANPYGIIKVNKGIPGIVSTLYAVYHPLNTVAPRFVDLYFANDLRLNKFLKPLVNIGAKHDMKVNNSFVLTGTVVFPSIGEQQKLVDFFAKLDRRIEAQRKIVDTLKKYKRGVFEAVFSRKLRLIPKARQSDWTAFKLGDFATRITRKNNGATDIPLTISAQYGLIDQRNFFSKVVASSDMSGYYLLRKGEYAYNRSTSNDYPFGSIKRLELYDEGAVSTLYLCFAIKEDVVLSDYAKWYFESSQWHRAINEICAEGARNHGLLNVPTDGFFDTVHILPSDIEEQTQIAAFLSRVHDKLAKAQEELNKLIGLRNGLMQQLFI